MTLQDESEAMDAVARTVARKTGRNRAELTLSNGIVLAFRPVPPMLINSLNADLDAKAPTPPVKWIEEKGREEPNPNDPAYEIELRRYERMVQTTLEDLALAISTTVVSVPEGFFRPEEDGWLKDPRIRMARQVGLEFDEGDEIKRLVVWLRYIAIETVSDVQLWMGIRVELTGVQEDEVADAMAAFGVTRHGEPITDWPLRQQVRTGITLTGLLEGQVSNYEAREAAIFGLYSWRAWCRLPHDEQVYGIAHYRMHGLIELHSADASQRDIDRNVRRGNDA